MLVYQAQRAVDIWFNKKRDALAIKTAVYEKSLSAAYSSEPKLRDIDFKLSAFGAKIAITALSGDKSALKDMQKQMQELSKEKKKILSAFKIKEISYDCENCKDTGYIDGKLCECVKEITKQMAFEELSRDMPIFESRFDNFNLNYYPNKENESGINPRKRITAILKLCREYVSWKNSPYISHGFGYYRKGLQCNLRLGIQSVFGY